MSELLKKALGVAKTNKGTLAEFAVGIPAIGVMTEKLTTTDSEFAIVGLSIGILGIFAIYCVYTWRTKKVTAAAKTVTVPSKS